MRKALSALILGASVLFAIIALHAEQNPWDGFYHSINRLGVQIRRSSTADTSATPAHHSSKKKHHPSPSPQEPADQTKESAAPTPKPSPEEGDKRNSSDSPESNPKKEDAQKKAIPPFVASLQPADLREFSSLSPKVQDLIRSALALTERNLGYTYGSSDPNSGGMDCSGFIYYVLTNAGSKDVPRQSSDQYLWVRKNSDFHAVLSRNSETFELKQLRPGDLMFWSGTYQIARDVPITHVMIYLGTEKKTKKPVMVGASDGRSYNGERRFGVSVFDFKLPSGTPNKNDPDLIPRFEGYASVPGLAENQAIVNDQSSASPTPTSRRPKLAEKIKPLSNGD
ncbi:MAG TPA: NlpC/P60 family protein [Chthoniobacterales bacterium]|jgi:cell wall-associated NlpC family hydrolase|nr:NlpC/P60 family protein [Chthoniobacterales bacterium]